MTIKDTIDGTMTKTEKFSAEKMQRIKRNLEQHKAMGQPLFYEIQMDGLKVVPKTDDIVHFDTYEMFLEDDIASVKVMLYQGGSHKYNSFVFEINENATITRAVKTLNEIPESVDEKIRLALRERDYLDIEKRNAELETELNEANDYIEILEKQVLEYQKQVEALGSEDRSAQRKDLMLLELIQRGTDFIKRNPKVLSGIPYVGETLAGDVMQQNMIEQKDRQAQLHQQKELEKNKAPEPNVTFKEKETQPQ